MGSFSLMHWLVFGVIAILVLGWRTLLEHDG